MFIVANYASDSLSMPKIFSAFEIILSLRYSIFMFLLGLGFFVEVMVAFDRFASIFNINHTAMIQIDPTTKESKKSINTKDNTDKS